MLNVKLKKMRTLAGLTLRGAALEAPCSGQYIFQLESGTRKNPSLRVLKGLIETYREAYIERFPSLSEEEIDNEIHLNLVLEFL